MGLARLTLGKAPGLVGTRHCDGSEGGWLMFVTLHTPSVWGTVLGRSPNIPRLLSEKEAGREQG